jgi:hypothetical protein
MNTILHKDGYENIFDDEENKFTLIHMEIYSVENVIYWNKYMNLKPFEKEAKLEEI